MKVEGYEDLLEDYKDTLKSLISDFNEAVDRRTSGEQFEMYFTSHELQFIRNLLTKEEDVIDGRY